MIEIKAWVGNLGKYNEGELVGEWVTFPITEEEQKALFKRIKINKYYEEYFCADYESELPLYDYFGEYTSIDTLNEMAEAIDSLRPYEEKTLLALLESGIYDRFDEALDNIDNYGLAEGMTAEEYEENLIAECYPDLDFDKMGWLSSYITIDYEMMARDDDRITETTYGVLYEC